MNLTIRNMHKGDTNDHEFPRDVFLCDFDGTITEQDVCDEIMREFSTTDWLAIGQLYDEGQYTHKELTEAFVSSFKGSVDQLRLLLERKITIRRGFKEFLSTCEKHNIQPLIISSGWDLYIREILGNDFKLSFPRTVEDIFSLTRDSLTVICNHIGTINDHDWNVQSQWPNTGKLSYPDKRTIANLLRKNRARSIMLAGDGSSDFEVADCVDRVFATNKLSSYCESHGVPYETFDDFLKIRDSIEAMRSDIVRVLSLPSYHPYTKRFDNGNDIQFANPDDDFFADSATTTPEYLEKEFPPEEYDVVHFHFEHYLIAPVQLEKLVSYFKQKKKPIIWTCHDRRSLLTESDDSTSERILFENADAVTTLTESCARWLEVTFGNDKKVSVIPHGYIAHPSLVQQEAELIKKDPGLFTIHIGDFRKSKDFIPAIAQFLECPSLNDARLQIIYRDIDPASMDIESARKYAELQKMMNNPRIEVICMKEISDTVMMQAFLRSHAIILPYLWGTHSGQLELARDCGCHVAASDVGFYAEQWNEVRVWSKHTDEKNPMPYSDVLTQIHHSPSLKPAGYWRSQEFVYILSEHKKIYKGVLSADHQ